MDAESHIAVSYVSLTVIYQRVNLLVEFSFKGSSLSCTKEGLAQLDCRAGGK